MARPERCTYENWRGISPQLLWAYDRSLSAEESRNMGLNHNCDENSAWLVTKGKVTLKTESETVVVGPGQWVLPPHGPRWQGFEGPMELRSITFRAKWHVGQHLFPLESPVVFEHGQYPEFDRLSQDLPAALRSRFEMKSWYLGVHELGLEDWLLTQELMASWLKIYSATTQQLGLRAEIPTKQDPRLQRAVALIESHPFDTAFSVSELAQDVGIGRRHLERLFLEKMGVSPAAAFDQWKLYRAKLWLLAPDGSVKETAARLGYADLSNFGRWFKRKTGRSPSDFVGRFGA